uniref:(northern house mosquito) hypothetical protein n=1 Tax=Culex pipiens TaxID=7175 RepID=A0A8D8K6T0_CULPI
MCVFLFSKFRFVFSVMFAFVFSILLLCLLISYITTILHLKSACFFFLASFFIFFAVVCFFFSFLFILLICLILKIQNKRTLNVSMLLFLFCLFVLCLYWLVSVLRYAFISCLHICCVTFIGNCFSNLCFVYTLCFFCVIIFFVHYIFFRHSWVSNLLDFSNVSLIFSRFLFCFTFYLQYVRSSISKRHHKLCFYFCIW